jgi:hypothetical protein
MGDEEYDDGYNRDSGIAETAPLADLDDGYHSAGEDEGVFRDKTPYDDDAEGVYRDDDSQQYRDSDNDGGYDGNGSYRSTGRMALDDDEDSVNKPRHID